MAANTKIKKLPSSNLVFTRKSEKILNFCNLDKIELDVKSKENNDYDAKNNNNIIHNKYDDNSDTSVKKTFVEKMAKVKAKPQARKDFDFFILKDMTNNLCNEDLTDDVVSGKHRHCQKKEIIARQRWAMLAKALFDPQKYFSQNSVRSFATFGLFNTENLNKIGGGHWSEYSYKVFGETYRIEIREVEQNLTAEQLAGFNNTGNVCIWPSEEVLAFFLLSNLTLFEGKQTLEVGGGMTCLAGLLLATYGKDCKVDLTDGNPVSVENVQKIIEKNALDATKVRSFQLDWVNHLAVNKTYDLVLSSDCLFFDDSRADLANTIWHALKDGGTAIVVAPKRGSTLNSFVAIAKRKGFLCTVRHYYNDTVWRKHLEFKASKTDYDENLHYPILLLLSKPDQSRLSIVRI